MPDVPLIALEIVLGFLVPIAWGVWELVQLKRDKRRTEAREREEPPTTPD
ncbi:hypothetical protein [Ideonella sp. A 288]|nr:hypothetical protein [Ideonella sp. A 288]